MHEGVTPLQSYAVFRHFQRAISKQIPGNAVFKSYSKSYAYAIKNMFTLINRTFPAIFWTKFGPFLVYIGHRLYHLNVLYCKPCLTGLQIHYFYTVPKASSKLRKREAFPFPLAVLAEKKEKKDNVSFAGLLFATK